VSFLTEMDALPLAGLRERAEQGSLAAAHESLGKTQPTLADFAHLLSLDAGALLETMAQRAHALTRQRFGKVIRLFAPLYLSNECINKCLYCGFSRDNAILRVTLTQEEILREAGAIREAGFRNLLLVAGEHPRFVSPDYLRQSVHDLRELFPSISLEVGPLSTEEYRQCVEAGADGLVVYQETYDRDVYAKMHVSGPKRDFAHRLETPERAAAAGFRRIGIGALYGLADWRFEALCTAAHAAYLLRHCWKSAITISLPRLRPCAGEFQPIVHMTDREMVQLVCAFRLFLPDVGLVLSTREAPRLRDGLIPLGITLISAGSHTEPGGYTNAGHEHLHLSQRPQAAGLDPAPPPAPVRPTDHATGQFEIADNRSPAEVASLIRRLGYEPVWKDWDAALSE